MSSNRLSIQFIRNVNKTKSDDSAIIENIDVDKFQIIYTDAEVNRKMSFSTDGAGVFRWIRRTLNLLESDADPFQCIQLNVPAMPSILLRVADIHSNYHTILDAVEFYLDIIAKQHAAQPSTPQSQRINSQECPHAPVRRHLFFNEDGTVKQSSSGIRYVERDFVY